MTENTRNLLIVAPFNARSTFGSPAPYPIHDELLPETDTPPARPLADLTGEVPVLGRNAGLRLPRNAP